MAKKVKNTPITKALVLKVLKVVDAGLSHGVGSPQPGQMCVEAAVAYAMGEPHTDNPKCVLRAIRDMKIGLNDSCYWNDEDGCQNSEKTKMERSRGLRKIAIAQLGSAKAITTEQWNDAMREYIFSKWSSQRRKTYLAGIADKRKKLEEALKNLEAGNEFYCNVELNESIDVECDYMNHVKNLKGLKRLINDMLKILIKLKSPGTKFLYLTK